jgi:hypothetical protein
MRAEETMNLSKRTTSKLPDSVKQHLDLYALAAGAAGVSILELAEPTEAKIVYTPAHVVIGTNQHYDLDLNHDGITDFTIIDSSKISYSHRCRLAKERLSALPNQGNGIQSHAAALSKGSTIGPTGSFPNGSALMVQHYFGEKFNFLRGCFPFNSSHGDWIGVTNRYLGLKFIKHGKTRYGWARLSVAVPGGIYGGSITATLTGYAYETIAGKSIKAGQTKEAAEDPTNEDFNPGASVKLSIPDTPQPASLGMLALGARGVPLWRRKESAFEGN